MTFPEISRGAKRQWIAFAVFLAMVLSLGLGMMLGIALAEKGILQSLQSADGRWEALVRSGVTFDPPEQSLWLRRVASGEETLLARLRQGRDRCDTVIWSEDGSRVAFLINGTRLLVFAPGGAEAVYEGELLDASRQAEGICVRGVEFLPAADGVRFGLCKRGRAGREGRAEVLF